MGMHIKIDSRQNPLSYSLNRPQYSDVVYSTHYCLQRTVSVRRSGALIRFDPSEIRIPHRTKQSICTQTNIQTQINGGLQQPNLFKCFSVRCNVGCQQIDQPLSERVGRYSDVYEQVPLSGYVFDKSCWLYSGRFSRDERHRG